MFEHLPNVAIVDAILLYIEITLMVELSEKGINQWTWLFHYQTTQYQFIAIDRSWLCSMSVSYP